ncbi:transglutaminase-like domain-containing protein [Egibacter rhizosphaerae]|uniref:transglutaminase-like domain-containing protein n=1 Tax=Egibacter rhizosphaerae TaxID=1670831 RepID=UPI0013F152F2|nr:transglutaminase-like domain-containing protein [Egibacter rhizosphaerae]
MSGWVRTHIAYDREDSSPEAAADTVLLRRTGVCRDHAHLATSLLRGLGVPARVVGVYAPRLDPPDFHAVVEAHDGLGWRQLDPTGLAPVDTVVRVATGRDGGDIAWATAAGDLTLDRLRVAVDLLP